MKKLILLVMLLAASAWAVPPAPYPFTVDSTSQTVPAQEAYQAAAKTFRVSFKDGGTAANLSGATPWMAWATGVTAVGYYTSATPVIVSATGGVVDFTFTAQSLNWSNGCSGIFGVGFTDSNSSYSIVRQGTFTIKASAFGAGVPFPVATTAINCDLYTFLNPPWANYTNSGYSKAESDAKYATGTPVYVEAYTGSVGTAAGLATGTPVYVEAGTGLVYSTAGLATGTPLYVETGTGRVYSTAGMATGSPLYVETGTGMVYSTAGLATGTPLYAFTETDTSATRTNIVAVSNMVTAETSARIGADSSLSNSISTNVTALIAADANLLDLAGTRAMTGALTSLSDIWGANLNAMTLGTMATNGASVIIGSNAVGVLASVAIGVGANAAGGGVAIGDRSIMEGLGISIGQLAKGSTASTAIGNMATGSSYSVSLGDLALSGFQGVALGRSSHAFTFSQALGSWSAADGTNIAIGYHANASSGTGRISIGPYVDNAVDNSVVLRGNLYLDGATGILYRSTFGSGDWSELLTAMNSADSLRLLKSGDTATSLRVSTVLSAFTNIAMGAAELEQFTNADVSSDSAWSWGGALGYNSGNASQLAGTTGIMWQAVSLVDGLYCHASYNISCDTATVVCLMGGFTNTKSFAGTFAAQSNEFFFSANADTNYVRVCITAGGALTVDNVHLGVRTDGTIIGAQANIGRGGVHSAGPISGKTITDITNSASFTNFVDRTSDQTIGGLKVFSGGQYFNKATRIAATSSTESATFEWYANGSGNHTQQVTSSGMMWNGKVLWSGAGNFSTNAITNAVEQLRLKYSIHLYTNSTDVGDVVLNVRTGANVTVAGGTATVDFAASGSGAVAPFDAGPTNLATVGHVIAVGTISAGSTTFQYVAASAAVETDAIAGLGVTQLLAEVKTAGVNITNNTTGIQNVGLAATNAGVGVVNVGLAATNAGVGVVNVGLVATNAVIGVQNVGLVATNASALATTANTNADGRWRIPTNVVPFSTFWIDAATNPIVCTNFFVQVNGTAITNFFWQQAGTTNSATFDWH